MTPDLLELQREALTSALLGYLFYVRSPGRDWREVSPLTYAGHLAWAARGDREGYAMAVVRPGRER